VKNKFDKAMDAFEEPVYEVLEKFRKEHPEAKEELEKKVNPPPKLEEHLETDRWA